MEDQNLTTPSPIPGAETEPNPLLRPTNPLVSNTEQEVLDEYARLLENVNKLSTKLSTLSGSPTSLTLDGLRHLERKTATVCTLLKASVYSIVLQQQIWNESEVERQVVKEQEQEQEEEQAGLGEDVGDGDGYGYGQEGSYYEGTGEFEGGSVRY